jgi:hypothetical protein
MPELPVPHQQQTGHNSRRVWLHRLNPPSADVYAGTVLPDDNFDEDSIAFRSAPGTPNGSCLPGFRGDDDFTRTFPPPSFACPRFGGDLPTVDQDHLGPDTAHHRHGTAVEPGGLDLRCHLFAGDPKMKTDRILPATRVVAVLVIPFLVVAFVILYLFPHDTERLFAWKIGPPMTAMMLGAAYAGGIYFFGRLLLARQWHRVKAGLGPVMTFAGLLGIATILHWDRFTHNHVAFWAWAGLYFTTPFIVLGVWLANRGQDPRRVEAGEATIPTPIRLVIGAVGALALAVSALLFLQPAVMITAWPWTLSPLTARVMSAMFALPGLVGLGVALDARWSAAQIILEAQGLSIALILLAVVLAWSDFDPAQPATWLFIGGLAAMLAGIAGLYVAFQVRQPRQSATAVR